MAQSIPDEKIRGEIFLDPSEKHLCTAGSSQLRRFLTKGARGKGFAVLSDRAVYCKGKCTVSRNRGSYQTRQTDFRLDLEEFQGLKYLQKKKPIFLVFFFLFLLLGPTLLLLDKLIHYSEGIQLGEKLITLNPLLDAVICLLLAGVFFLLYSIHQKSLLELKHTNGSVCLDLRYLPEKEERLLIRYLRAFLSSRQEQMYGAY